MSSSGTDKKHRTDSAAEQTGDFIAGHNTESSGGAAEAAGPPDPLLSLLRPPQADGELGRLADFAVTRLLGRGGMGAVYAADDLLLHRQVALKVMRPELTARPEARERFLREAQTAGGLENDHIIPVYQVGQDHGVLFIAMPLLKGEALDARLAREGRLPIAAVLKLGRETAEGLAAAHAQGLVHRDVKPANLWLEGTGEAGGVGFRRIKILDFGLARAVQDDQHLTAAGGVLGTPAYMAPEQAAGEEVDGRADLFSLGAVLYRCCTGEAPFAGTTMMAILSAIANREPAPLREKNPAAPAALEGLVMRMLAKAPGDRPQSAEEVAEALRGMEQEHGTVTAAAPAPTPAPRRRRVSVLTACLAAVLGLGLAVTAGVIVVKVRTPDGKETQVTAPTGSKVDVDAKGNVTVTLPADAANKPAADPAELEFRLKEGSAPVSGLVVAPDGKTIVAGYGDGQLRVWDLEKRKVVRSDTAKSGVMALALHPDGNTVAAMCEDGSLFTWDMGKGEVIRQFTGYPVHAWGVTFAKKGDLIVTPDRETQAVVCWDAKTGEHRVLARFPDEKFPLGYIASSPDGEQVAVTTIGGPARLLNLSSGDVVWTSRWLGWATPVFLQDGKTVAVGHGPLGTIWAWDPAAHYPSKVFCGESSASLFGMAVSPDGRLLAAAGGVCGKVGLWAQDGSANPVREWAVSTAAVSRVAFTGDSRRLIAIYQDGVICVFKVPDTIPAWHGFPPLDPAWIARTTKLTPDEQVKEVTAELARRNPGFSDTLDVFAKDGEGQVVGVRVETRQLEDLSPFRGFPRMRMLGVTGKGYDNPGRVWDLSCLQGMNLTILNVQINPVLDLSPLRGMPLEELWLSGCPVCDLSPLRGMKLRKLVANMTCVDDLSPLHGMPLDDLWLHYSPVKDFSPLMDCPLRALDLSPDGVTDFKSMRGLSVEYLSLQDVELTGLTLAQRDVLRTMPKLKVINGKAKDEFLKAIDAGDKPKPGG